MKKTLSLIMILGISFCIGGCGPSQEELDAKATEERIALYETQTAQAPTGTPTSTPTQTPTATYTPEPTSTPEPTPTPLGGGGTLAFASDREGAWGIYAIDLSLKEVTNLTLHSFGDTMPSWSPSGDEIVFVSSQDYGMEDIYIAQSNGELVVSL